MALPASSTNTDPTAYNQNHKGPPGTSATRNFVISLYYSAILVVGVRPTFSFSCRVALKPGLPEKLIVNSPEVGIPDK